MDPLDYHDKMHLRAAEGWLGLGNYVEANRELDDITATKRSHPAVLQVRFHIYEKAQDWAACADIASAMVRLSPESPFGWVHRSLALHKLRRTGEALECLLPAHALFPQEIVVRYNLACYHCVLGDMVETKRRLAEALKLAFNQNRFDQWRLAALNDPDLEAIWNRLDEIWSVT